MKYSCRAPGKHKGYCPCMYFLAARAAQGNRIRAPWRLAKKKK
jgi:hypothetical protein